MSDDDENSPFQTIYDYLVLADHQWASPFRDGNPVARNWAQSAIERLAMMTGGQDIEFATGGMTEDGFDLTATAIVFTSFSVLELEPTTLLGRSGWQPADVTASPRAALRQLTLQDVRGPVSEPWQLQVELVYEGREKPLVIESGTSVQGRTAPAFDFLASLLADLHR